MAALLLAALAAADAFTLDNGLRVVVTPVPGASKAAVVVLFSIGEHHDPEGRSGLAHLLEHLYVTAAAGDAPARTVADLVRAYPDGHNAQTGARYTAVASVVPGARLDAELRDAAARMGALKMTAPDLARERPRLLAEVDNMFGRIPQLGARNLATEALRPTPRGGRRGGLPEHVARIKLDELRDSWRRYYKPSNAILSVAGACDPATVRRIVEELFGGLPRGEVPPKPASPEVRPATGVTTVTVKPIQPGMKPHVAVAYGAPPPTHEDYVPYLVLAARLMQDARRTGAVHFAPLDDPDRLTLATPGTDPAPLARRVDEQTARPLAGRDASDRLAPFGFLLGVTEVPLSAFAANPYAIAFSRGRRLQMSIDPDALRARLKALTSADLERARSWFSTAGRAVVRFR